MSDIVLASIVAAVAPTATIIWKAVNDKRWRDKNVGQSNGQGTVVEMLERSLRWQGEHEEHDRKVYAYLGVPEEVYMQAGRNSL